jgi:hypothetical protein
MGTQYRHPYYILLIILGLAVTITASVEYIDINYSVANPIETSAIVQSREEVDEEYIHYGEKKTRTVIYVEYSFNLQGRIYNGHANSNTRQGGYSGYRNNTEIDRYTQVGDNITICYNSEDPSLNSAGRKRDSSGSLLLGAIGIAIIAKGLIDLKRRIEKRNNTEVDKDKAE